jgi:hypothetical protein
LVFIGLAVFVFLQKSKSPKLGNLLVVAVGLALLGVISVIGIPFNVLGGVLQHGTLPARAVALSGDSLMGVGWYVGLAGVVVGFTLTAVDLANGVEASESTDGE